MSHKMLTYWFLAGALMFWKLTEPGLEWSAEQSRLNCAGESPCLCANPWALSGYSLTSAAVELDTGCDCLHRDLFLILECLHWLTFFQKLVDSNMRISKHCNTQKLSIRHTKFEFLEMTSPWVCFDRQNLKIVLQAGFKFRQALLWWL